MKYPHAVQKDDLFGLFEQYGDIWNIFDYEFPFVTLTSTTNGARNFPVYDIIEQPDGKVRLELAAAGYSKDQLTVEKEGNVLIIRGAAGKPVVSSPTPNPQLLGDTHRHHGISRAAWLRTFDLHQSAIIESVAFQNGILTVVVSIPKPTMEEKPRTTFEIK